MMNDDLKNKSLQCALNSMEEAECYRIELMDRILGLNSQPEKILYEMDNIIQFTEMYFAYLYRKYILHEQFVPVSDRYLIYHRKIDIFIKREYPWLDEVSKSSLVGKLSYR